MIKTAEEITEDLQSISSQLSNNKKYKFANINHIIGDWVKTDVSKLNIKLPLEYIDDNHLIIGDLILMEMSWGEFRDVLIEKYKNKIIRTINNTKHVEQDRLDGKFIIEVPYDIFDDVLEFFQSSINKLEKVPPFFSIKQSNYDMKGNYVRR